jgi:hypothetical protein
MRPNLPVEITDRIALLKKLEPGTNPTECCYQLSWAFNMGGLKIPTHSFWRENTDLGRGGRGIGACDEMEVFLTTRFGPTEDIKRTYGDIGKLREAIAGRQGVLLFRDPTPGWHVELWQDRNIKQRGGAPGGMSEGFIFGQPRILFWEFVNSSNADDFNVPSWLTGWWFVSDGNPYWYYFSDQGTVSHVRTKPKSFNGPPMVTNNSGKVTIRDSVPQVVINWNATGGAVTVEKFSMWGNKEAMSGTSNRFAPLQATKIKSA